MAPPRWWMVMAPDQVTRHLVPAVPTLLGEMVQMDVWVDSARWRCRREQEIDCAELYFVLTPRTLHP